MQGIKAIITADWHLRDSRPRCRIDEDWFSFQMLMLSKIKDIAIEYDCPVICVGDIFNSNSDVSRELLISVAKWAEGLPKGLFLLAGNHDLLQHSIENLNKSAIGELLQARGVHELQNAYSSKLVFAPHFGQEGYKEQPIVFEHILCFPDKKLIPMQKEGIMHPEAMLEKYKNAAYIFIGDYHRAFIYSTIDKTTKHKRVVLNPGCLIRQAADLADYKPSVYFVDTENNKEKVIYLDDPNELVDDEYLIERDIKESRIAAFVEKIKSSEGITLDYVQNVLDRMEGNKVLKQAVKDLVIDLLGVN